jgi:hypothetical protein
MAAPNEELGPRVVRAMSPQRVGRVSCFFRRVVEDVVVLVWLGPQFAIVLRNSEAGWGGAASAGCCSAWWRRRFFRR